MHVYTGSGHRGRLFQVPDHLVVFLRWAVGHWYNCDVGSVMTQHSP